MAVMKTPGVYIVEKNAFPNSVVQVATAVPAFIGYTQTAMNGNVSLHDVPHRITSMTEFHSHFGGAPEPTFKIVPFEERAGATPLEEGPDGAMRPAELPQAEFIASGPMGSEKFELVQVNKSYALYGAMRLFFQNGGGACYVTSIGTYDGNEIDSDAMLRAIKRLEKEPEPTMVVIPETTRLNRQDAIKVQQAMLNHCGGVMKNRFAILDIFGGYLEQNGPRGQPVARFRGELGINDLDYAAAYYPWLNSSIFGARDFTFENIDFGSRNTLISLLKRSVANNVDLVPEIERVGTPVLTGDFTISVPDGGTVLLNTGDISAKDDASSAAGLSYQVTGKPEDLPAQMAGMLVMTGTKEPLVTTFTQQELAAGAVSFIHDPALGAAGKFDLVVTDETGVATNAHTIAVVTGSAVLGLPAVTKGGATAIIDVAASHAGADAATVLLLDADPVDEAAAIEADAGAKAAKEAAEAADAKKPAKDKAATEAKRVIDALTGKTKTVPKVGVWSADPKGSVTFAPVADFAGPEASVQYTIEVGGEVQGPEEIKVLLDGVVDENPPEDPSVATIDKTMRAIVPLYTDVMNSITKYMNSMPPAAAMAGIYTAIDNSRGVWKAPANVSVNSVSGPMVNIDHAEQEDLNVSTTGKSINAIRPFVGEGTLVWGARTLDGNSLDWRYINVRRTMIMIEESIRLASKAYVFEPNTANTWVTIRSMIENFLTGVWKAGGLAGSVATDAFSVHCGLGETMTPVDILEGRLNITVLVAVTRPAEFIEITFMQQMQKS